LDQKLGTRNFAGVEYSLRELDIPLEVSTGSGFTERTAHWNERLLRAYLLSAPHDWFSTSLSYEWERLDRDRLLANGARRVETHRVPFAINFFHPSGLSATARSTYIHQNGNFEHITTGLFESGSVNFWTLDLATNYRLPKRLGFFTIGATNVTNRRFNYLDTDVGTATFNPRVLPGRIVYGKLTLAFQ
jgi:hypothetical protein